MRYIVDCQCERVVDGPTQEVGKGNDEVVGELTYEVTGEDLEYHHSRYDVLELWIRSHQLLDFRVFLCVWGERGDAMLR